MQAKLLKVGRPDYERNYTSWSLYLWCSRVWTTSNRGTCNITAVTVKMVLYVPKVYYFLSKDIQTQPASSADKTYFQCLLMINLLLPCVSSRQILRESSSNTSVLVPCHTPHTCLYLTMHNPTFTRVLLRKQDHGFFLCLFFFNVITDVSVLVYSCIKLNALH